MSQNLQCRVHEPQVPRSSICIGRSLSTGWVPAEGRGRDVFGPSRATSTAIAGSTQIRPRSRLGAALATFMPMANSSVRTPLSATKSCVRAFS